MKRIMLFILAALLTAALFYPAEARNIRKNDRPVIKAPGKTDLKIDDKASGFYKAASVDTYTIVRYDFETLDWQGWERVDNTADPDTFFHVDDFSGLESYGRLEAIEGSQSIWCGSRPADDYYMCSWAAAPGYGNNWEQYLVSEEVVFEGSLHLDYHLVYDCEGAGYDNLYIEYENDDGSWTKLATYGGIGDVIDSYSVDSASVGGSTRFRFYFSSDGAWSDEDGLWPTEGAAVIDSITVYDTNGYFNYEDFESASVGDHSIGIWQAETGPAFGRYSGLREGMRILDGDPCNENLNTQIVFFEGSTEPADERYPGLYVTPFCLNGGGTEAPCQNESVYSPEIVMTKYSSNNDEIQDMTIPAGDQNDFAGVILKFDMYVDLPLDNLVFHTWAVRNIKDGCPHSWMDLGYRYYYLSPGYSTFGHTIGDLLTSPNDTLVINLNVIDMCDAWGGTYGSCTYHTPAPWFDNVMVQRYDISGPQWRYRMLDLFQDNFPPNADYTGFVRADAANDIAGPAATERIDPGDSITVHVTSPLAGGIAGVDANGYENGAGTAEVYMHFKVYDAISGAVPADFAASVDTGDVGAYPLPTPTSEPDGWFKVQGRNAVVGENPEKVADEYMFDLNDAIFTYNHVIEYYFSATDKNAETSYLPSNALEGGSFEWECLPSQPTVYSILYVDDFDHRGSWDGQVDNYMTPALNTVSATGYDRYDVNAPTSGVGNGLASRINVDKLSMFYEKIIWDSGDLPIGTINNGTDSKEDDCALLEAWADDADAEGHKTNLLVMGDGVVANLTDVGATSFMTNTLGVQLVNASYYNRTGGYTGGGVTSPLITAVAGGPFDGLENFYAFGGCPIINSFDVLDVNDPLASGALQYPDGSYAGISMDDVTSQSQPKRAITTGFSIMAMRDANDSGAPVRNEFLEKVFDFFANGVNGDITDVGDTPKVTKLHGNYPNPFNPSTTIKFEMKAEGHVSIRIYDVAGRLVNTLVNEVRGADTYKETWNGTNNRDASVASGVYFYRMDTRDYSRTRKMVLLR